MALATPPTGGTGRFVPVREFTCPNHPHGRYESDCYECGGVPDVAFDVARELHDRGDDRLWVELGLCCEEHEWVPKIGEDGEPVMREVSVFEDMLARTFLRTLEQKPIFAANWSSDSVKIRWLEDGLKREGDE